jgi:hypothetical protein
MKFWKMSLASLAIAALPAVASAQQVVTTTVEKKPIALDIGAETGTLVTTQNDDAGFAYGARVGINLGRFLALEGRYLGATGIDPGRTAFNSGAIDLKLAAPIALGPAGRTALLPYVTGGLGIYGFREDSVGRALPQVPVGVGLMIDVNEDIGIGGEFMYHFLFDSALGNGADRSSTDVWNLTANVIYHF